jgi:hypothetical protein
MGEAIAMFYRGDEAGPKKTAAQLASDIGFEPFPGRMGREFAFQLLTR